jgi:plastocyanin
MDGHGAAGARCATRPAPLQNAIRLAAALLALATWGCAGSAPTPPKTAGGEQSPTSVRTAFSPTAEAHIVHGRVLTRGVADTVSLKQAVVYVVDDLESSPPAVAANSGNPTAKKAHNSSAHAPDAKAAAKAPAKPKPGTTPTRAPEEPERMCQTASGFRPRIVAIPAGSMVEFDNCDSIYHSVFSLAKAKHFDTGLFAPGKAKPVRFDQPGVVDVYCQLHSHVVGTVVIVPNRHFARPNAKGEFRLPPLKEGTYVVKVWHPRFGETTQTLQVARDGSGAVSLAF